MALKKLVPAEFKQNLTNALGWKTRRKIVVFESDDWGSLRMPSQSTYDTLSKQGLLIDDHYNRFDSLETAEDLSALCDVLTSVRDKNGKNAVITANYLVANPDFERIKAVNFGNYHYELFTETYKKAPGCSETFQVLNQAISAGLLRPQYHGREHLNVPLWMEALQSGDRDALLAFDYGTFGHASNYKNANRGHFLSALDYNSQDDIAMLEETVVEGARLFQQVFGYNSKSFIAPTYVWSAQIEQVLAKEGVTLLQGQRNQLVPVVDTQRCKPRFHFSGQKNRFGQRYLVRNAFFEPSSDASKDWLADCLKDISRAFSWKTPAVICSHRVNFMGTLSPENRDNNLSLLKQLLDEVTHRWPDVEFLSTDQLGALMESVND